MSVKQKTVLSIDGGGIRGIIPAMILAKIESQTLDNIRELIQKSTDKTEEEKAVLHAEVKDKVKIKDGKEFMPTAELFHLIAGTSTGGILALALTMRDPNAPKQPQYTAEELADFYPADGKKIFGRSLWRRLPGVGYVTAKYSSDGITSVLNKRLGGTMLSDALTPVLIPSYEMVKREAWFFRSRRAKKQSDYDFRMQDVALATSAAPTYFPEHEMTVTTKENGQTVEYDGRFVDGGIYANHPAMCAYVEAEDPEDGIEGENILLVSLGTGEQMPFAKGKRGSGIIFWKERIFNAISDGASDTVKYQLKKVMSNDKRFYRFQIPLIGDDDDIKLDDVKAVKRLRKMANDFIGENADRLNGLCRCLAQRFLHNISLKKHQDEAS